MDVATTTARRRLVPSEKDNAVDVTRHPRTTEVSSRYRSPTPSKTRRSPSPSVTRPTVSSSSQCVAAKRAVSADRKRPSTPPSPSSPSTPIRDTSIDLPVSSRRLSTGRLPESLWPSTMRSLSFSFQSDSVSVPVSKKEKPARSSSVDRTLRPASNISQKQKAETTSISRKPTPERTRSPLKGKNNVSDRSENSKPVDGSHSRLIEQHRWPSRIGGKITSHSLNRSLDLGDKASRGLSTSGLGLGQSLRRMSLPLSSGSKPIRKTSSNTSSNGVVVSPTKSEDNNIARTSGAQKLWSASSLDRATLATAVAKLHPLSGPGSRPASPSRASFSSSSSISRGMSTSRGVSPSRGLSPVRGSSPPRGLSPSRGLSSSRIPNSSFTRPSTPPLRVISPSRIRPTSTSTHSTTTSALSFITDVKKGRKTSYIEDVHQLRLLHNRYLQWRFAIARAEAVMYIQRLTSEETLFNVWHAKSELQDHVASQRIGLQQLKLEIKLNSLLTDQMVCLEDWATLERDHVSSLFGAIADLEANTLRLPATGGTKVDVESLISAMSSALDVMQATGSSIWSLLSKVEEMNKLVSELAVVVTKESCVQGKCEDLLASTVIMQIKECSLMTHLIQQTRLEEGEDEEETPLLLSSKFPWP